MLGILTPNSGEVEIFGKSPEKTRHEIYPRINFSSAYIQLPFNLKVKTNLKIFSSLYNIKNPRQKIDSLVQMFNLENLLEERTGALSSGEQTRLNLCKCLLNDPEILFLDEPTASLDPEISERVRGILMDIYQERHMTIIYTSHNMDEVEKLCARIIFLHQGKKWIDAATDQVKAQFGGDDLEQIFIQIARQKEART
jgi:ABC-2 type transport system ATP-binding protein